MSTVRGGWLHTGDLGSFDENGFLTLRDRSKDMSISGGSNIYPREIEEVLLRHPDLVEASVVGRPHREWGEEVVAFAVARPGAEIAAEALDRLCLDHIARFKRPRDYRFVDALPKNNYGKVLKTNGAGCWPTTPRQRDSTRSAQRASRSLMDTSSAGLADRRPARTAPGSRVAAADIC